MRTAGELPEVMKEVRETMKRILLLFSVLMLSPSLSGQALASEPDDPLDFDNVVLMDFDVDQTGVESEVLWNQAPSTDEAQPYDDPPEVVAACIVCPAETTAAADDDFWHTRTWTEEEALMTIESSAPPLLSAHTGMAYVGGLEFREEMVEVTSSLLVHGPWTGRTDILDGGMITGARQLEQVNGPWTTR